MAQSKTIAAGSAPSSSAGSGLLAPPRRRGGRVLGVSAGIIWVLTLLVGEGFLLKYQMAPGERKTPPDSWPAESRLDRPSGKFTLLLFAHPHCPCTQATLGELQAILPHRPQDGKILVLFLQPPNCGAEWARTDLWGRAASIPGVDVRADVGGTEARRFGVTTSGHVLLFDAQGQRLFSGGITGSRGHAGDNPGKTALISLLTQGTADRHEFPVFGCPLFEESVTRE